MLKGKLNIKSLKTFVLFMVFSIIPFYAYAVTGDLTISDKEIIERLVRLEEGQKAMNIRFDDMNRRFDELVFWIQMIFGSMILILMGIISGGILLWRRQTRIETLLENHLKETEKNRLIALHREEIEMLKGRLERLEKVVAT